MSAGLCASAGSGGGAFLAPYPWLAVKTGGAFISVSGVTWCSPLLLCLRAVLLPRCSCLFLGRKTPVILDAGPTPFQCGCILTGLHLQRLDLQKGSYSQVLGLKTFNISFVGNTVQLQQLCKFMCQQVLIPLGMCYHEQGLKLPWGKGHPVCCPRLFRALPELGVTIDT